jgi:hypothetical protein
MGEAVVAGRLGSLDAGRAGKVAAELKEEFGAKRLLSVPGFERGHPGRVSLSLPGKVEYVLLPCFDGEGLLAGVEALEYDPERGELADPDRTVPLSGASAHLYVFALYSPKEIEGFCEGPLAAILAAQEDVVLGAIGHFRRYASDAGSTKNAGRAGAALPELEGMDFGGREIAYVPRVGPGEENARSREAWAACRFLVERQNGVARLAFPSSPEPTADHAAAGSEARPEDAAPRSLLEWILSLPEEDRQECLKELFPKGPHRNEPSPGSGPREANEGTRGAGEAGGDRRGEPPEIPASSALATVTLMASVAAMVDLLLGRAEAFGQYVGLGYGGQPSVVGGLVGQLRELARSAPMEALYALRKPASLLVGVAVGVGRLGARTKLQRHSEDLRRFQEGPWRAHLVGERERASRAPSKAPVTPKEVVEGLAGGALGCALLYLALDVAGRIYGAMVSLGMTDGSYEMIFEGSGRIAAIGGLACGLYVLARRAALRRQGANLIEGRIEP